tara:strand:- start:36 stop:794 length:759 start_codon:yes stop_codon:yes gene_type:complete
MKNKRIAVWFSCGAASAVAAKITNDYYGYTNRVHICNNPILEEGEDNQRFLRDVALWIGVPIEIVTSKKYPNASCKEVWTDRRYMSGIHGAPCTLELKKKPRQAWEAEYNPDYTVLGFTAEETARAERFKMTERDTLLTPLIDLGITKQDCFDIINKAGIRLPDLYRNGHPNANCLGCVKVNSPTYWNWLRVTYPDVFKDRLEQSRKIGAKLVRVKGEYIQLEDLDPKAKGHKMKSYDIDCGIFCEEGAWKK